MGAPFTSFRTLVRRERTLILVTVGTQLPFDRLIECIDDVSVGLNMPVFAQVGNGTYKPRNITWKGSVAPVEFERLFSDSAIIIAHAGIGTVLAAQKFRKPIIVFPRRAELGEHRNNHQLATCKQLEGRVGIYVAWDESDLRGYVSRSGELSPPVGAEPKETSSKLTEYLNRLVQPQVGR
jgi:UDP-N-acetylglucosamine transferase subunit ALG13